MTYYDHHAEDSATRSYWEQQQERARLEREARLAASPEAQARARLRALTAKLIDRAESLVDQIAAKPAAREALPPIAARRQVAQILGSPRFCSRKICRRTKACCGEPKHCLAVALPLLPPELIEKLALGARKTRRGRPR